MDVLKTILGTDIPTSTRGIVYLCTLKGDTLTVDREIVCDDAYTALQFYANIPNPESQMVSSETFDGLIAELIKLHENINNPAWVEELWGYM